ncbi:protein Mdm4 isoform X2 [Brachyhypopomus gauderio]|uniref:protein Mdm4 isoform X2 n=1 Tax=Brachyhypopomus gauderio TaxID=698409 RepID=UPI0040419329
MTSLSSALRQGSSCRALPGEGSQVQPKAPLLQILRVGGAQEEIFTLKEVMHYLGQYIIVKELYDKQRQHIVHCQDDPLGELLEVESFSVKNPSPVYEMLKRNLFILNCSDAAKNVSVDKESNESPCEDPGQVSSCMWGTGPGFSVGTATVCPAQSSSQRRPRDADEDSLDGLPRSASKRPKLDVSLDEWDLSGLPWWFLGNLRNNYTRRSNGSTDIHTNQEEDTAIVSDTTDDLWFLNEAESEQVSVEMKEAALEQGSDTECPPEEEQEHGQGLKEDKEMQEDLDDDSQCLSDDTDTEISAQDAWQCGECRKFNSSLQCYCMHCWAMRKHWYKDCPRLAPSVSTPDIAAAHEDEDASGVDVPDCPRTVSDPAVLPSHQVSRNLPPCRGTTKGKAPARAPRGSQESSESEGQELAEGEAQGGRRAMLEPCRLCRVRPRDGNIVHGRTAHLITCFPCARKLLRFHAPCPGCGQVIQKVIKTFVA